MVFSSFFDYSFTTSLVILVLCFLAYFSVSTFNFWKNVGIPFLEPVPFFGNTYSLTFGKENISNFISKVYKSFPGHKLVGCFMLREPVLVIKDPEIINTILTKDFNYFSDRVVDFINVNKKLNPLSGNLFTLQGNRWKKLRQKLTPVFTSGKLKTMLDQMKECGNILLESLNGSVEKNSVVEMRELTAKFATDVIGTCAFGLNCQAVKDSDSEFRRISRHVFAPRRIDILKSLMRSIDPQLVTLFRIPDRPKFVTDFYTRIVSETLNYRKQNGVRRNDFLQLLMDIYEENSTPVSDNNYATSDDVFDKVDVIANAFSFFVAGFENISLVMSYTLYEIALNEDVQQKVVAEIRSTKEKYKGETTAEYLKELVYLDMVICETLRKHPPAPIVSRKCTMDYTFPTVNVRIKSGTKVIIPTYGLHHDPAYYPKPEIFDPDRFTQENRSSRPNGTYLPFGEGPRFCVGKSFAQMEMKLALSEIVLNFKLSPCDKTDVPMQYLNGTPFLMAKNGVWLKVEKRKA